MTSFLTLPQSLHIHFNSHPHEEDDGNAFILSLIWLIFQLTSSRRGWLSLSLLTDSITPFQLTSSRRGWLCSVGENKLCNYFNSHPHEEDDHLKYPICFTFSISTHILTKRMTAILNKNNLFKIAYYISNKHFISIVDIFFHFHIYF